MNLIDALKLTGELLNLFDNIGILKDGKFTRPSTSQEAMLIARVIPILNKYGIELTTEKILALVSLVPEIQEILKP